MTRVFLSYATPDSATAAQLTRDWRERGVEVFRFGDPEHQGEIIVDEIEREMRLASVFVAVMSPAYLASRWCRTESQLAIHKQNGLDSQFIYVVEVAETPKDDVGMLLRIYSWVPALGELTAGRLDQIAAALPFGGRPSGGDLDFPGFRNRGDELATLLGGLRGAGGRELWVVVSPPLMGKTWLLIKLEKELVNSGPPWSVHRLDLRREPAELRYDPARLVAALLQVEGVTALGPDDLQAVALAVNDRPEPLLFVLDGAELLTPACAASTRSALTAVHRLVRQVAGRRERFALVIATRRPDEWRGLGPDARTGRRFETLNLSRFDEDVVYQALLDARNDLGAERRWSHAARLQQLSEGLPALLVRCVQWATSTGFLRMAETEESWVFDAVGRDYIQKDLLSADCLLSATDDRSEAALLVLRRTLAVLSTYRLYTQSHIAFHLGADVELRRALELTGWTSERLWEALGRTALQSNENASEIWHEIEPALRRLLHRYHHRTDAERSAAHAVAGRFYRGWAQDKAAGREQQVVLVECLWHEAARLTIDEPRAVPDRLPPVAAELARTLDSGPMFQAAEFRGAVERRLNADDELQLLLRDHEGLFATIVEVVTTAIGGDE